MKKFFICLLLLAFVPTNLLAQTDTDSISQQNIKPQEDKLIPISRQQAEILVTEIVKAQLEEENRAEREIIETKLEALKRKLLDNALRKAYTQETNERLNRLETLLYVSLLSDGKIDPQVLHTILTSPSAPGQQVLPIQQQLPPGLLSLLQDQQGTEKTEGQANSDSEGKLNDKPIKTDSNGKPCVTQLRVPNENGTVETVYVTADRVESFLHQVFFKFDSSVLSGEAKKTLDKVVDLLNENPTLTITLQGYASPEGNLQYNNKLSGRRVNACADYIVSKGIDKNRLEVKMAGIDSVTSTLPEARRVDIKPVLCD